MNIMIYILLCGSVAINVAISVQVYRLHKSFLDLKEKLNIEDSKYDKRMRIDMENEVGAVAEKKAAEKEERRVRQEAEDNAWREKSTIFEDEDELVEKAKEVVASTTEDGTKSED